MDTNEHIFYRAARETFRQTWLCGLALCLMWFGIYQLIIEIGAAAPFFNYLGIILFCVSCYLFLIGFLSLIFSNVMYARIDSNGITISTGIIGFRKTNHIEWKKIEYIEIAKKNLIYYDFAAYLGLWQMELPANVLLFHLKTPLLESEILNINKLSTNNEPNIHHIRVSEDGYDIWLKKPPGGGFEALLREISKYVKANSIPKTSPKRYKTVITSLDIILFSLVSVVLFLVGTDKICLW